MIASTDTPAQAWFREIVQRNLARGVCPTPTDLNRAMGWSGGHNINGWATRIRREELEARGWKKVNGRWRSP